MFDPKKLNKLNNPERLKDIPPEYIWNKLALENVKTIVDIGAGTGFFSIPFMKLSGAKQVFACDISETMINWMQENLSEEHPNILPIQMKEEILPLENSIADLVFMITLHHELKNPLENLKEARRLLKKGGKIFIIDWKTTEMKQGPPLNVRCKTEDVKEQIKEAGFTNIIVDDSLPKFFLIIGEVL